MTNETRPLITHEHEVKAILDKREPQLRRVLSYTPPTQYTSFHHITQYGQAVFSNGYTIDCPFGSVGDLLYVREAWAAASNFDHTKPSKIPAGANGVIPTWYKAGGDRYVVFDQRGKWRSPVQMPKWAARIWLRVTNLRVEQLQDASVDDALREGVAHVEKYAERIDSTGAIHGATSADAETMTCFFELWDSVYAKRGYKSDDNPLVWIASVEVISTDGKPIF